MGPGGAALLGGGAGLLGGFLLADALTPDTVVVSEGSGGGDFSGCDWGGF